MRLGSIGLRVGIMDANITYYFVLILSIICIAVIWQVLRSPYGHVLRAIREKRETARASAATTWRKSGSWRSR